METDIVCGMDCKDLPSAVRRRHEGREYVFCDDDCERRFLANPGRYIGNKPLLSLQNVSKIFHLGNVEVPALRKLDLNVWEGDFVSIIGASGSGKSTALSMIGLLDRPSSGRIFLRGQDVSLLNDDERAALRSRTFGFVFQQYNLIPWLTAYENASLPLIFANGNANAESLGTHFKEIGLAERLLHRPLEMSGGEQQRVAIIRALANDPEIIIADEPTGNLDSATGNKILELLITLQKGHKKTLVIVTHDADIAKKADQVVVLKDGMIEHHHEAHRKMYTE